MNFLLWYVVGQLIFNFYYTTTPEFLTVNVSCNSRLCREMSHCCGAGTRQINDQDNSFNSRLYRQMTKNTALTRDSKDK